MDERLRFVARLLEGEKMTACAPKIREKLRGRCGPCGARPSAPSMRSWIGTVWSSGAGVGGAG